MCMKDMCVYWKVSDTSARLQQYGASSSTMHGCNLSSAVRLLSRHLIACWFCLLLHLSSSWVSIGVDSRKVAARAILYSWHSIQATVNIGIFLFLSLSQDMIWQLRVYGKIVIKRRIGGSSLHVAASPAEDVCRELQFSTFFFAKYTPLKQTDSVDSGL